MTLPYRILAGVLLLIGALVGGFFAGRHVTMQAWNAAKAHQQAAVATHEALATRITLDVALKYDARIGAIHATTRQLAREVPIYVTHDEDRRYPIPVGFVRLYDAAAEGVPLPDTAGPADASPSATPLSAVAGNLVSNYGACHAIRAQLVGLQGWVRRQAGAK